MITQLPNRFDQRIEAFISEMKALPFPIEGVRWEDTNWGNAVTFSKLNVRWTQDIPEASMVGQPLRDLAKACLVYWITHDKAGDSTLKPRLDAFKFIDAALADLQTPSITQFASLHYERCLVLITEASESTDARGMYNSRLNQAVNFLQGKRYLKESPPKQELKRLFSADVITRTVYKSGQKSASSVAEKDMNKRAEKLPPLEVILATGSIFYQAMPKDGEPIDCFENTVDRVVSSYLALSMCTPNRMNEVVMLDKGGINTQSTWIRNKGVKEKVTAHRLRYRGSKGMGDFSKPIPESMVPIAKKTANYLKAACEPGRILVRYYEDQAIPLKELVKGSQFKIPKGLDKEAPVTLWQLGGVLGFYDDLPPESRLHRISGFPYSCDLQTHVSKAQIADIFGMKDRKWIPIVFRDCDLSLNEVQNAFITHLMRSLPHFPYRKHKNGKKIHLADALFVLTGNQLEGQRTGYVGGASFYGIEPVNLATYYAARLTGEKTQSIFLRYGFTDPIYRLTSHQPRHFINTLAQKGGMAEEILAKWSGRASVAQNAVYDHRTDDEKHAEVVALLYEEEEETREIIVVDAATFEAKTGTPAHKMLTGYCVQSLHVDPCLKQNQCLGCKQNCHVKGDERNLAIIQADRDIQQQRLAIAIRQAEENNVTASDWIDIHQEKLNYSNALIDVLTNDEIEDGAIICFLGDGFKMRICNAAMSDAIEYQPRLPDLSKKQGKDYLPAPVKQHNPLAALDALISGMTNSNQEPSENPLADVERVMEEALSGS